MLFQFNSELIAVIAFEHVLHKAALYIHANLCMLYAMQ
jgi:hypothetical protein